MARVKKLNFIDREWLGKVHPRKRLLFEETVELAWTWLRAHGLELPGLVATGDERFVGKSNFGCYWNYRARTVVIDVAKCSLAKRIHGTLNFPRSFEDNTPVGVVAHEVGHHVDRVLGRRRGISWISSLPEWIELVNDEPDVGRQETDTGEAFAEAFRLLLTNPDLLRVGRFDRYEFLVDRLGFRPPGRVRPWRKVLAGASPELVCAVERWIADQ